MDNLIRSLEDHKNEREIWVAVSTLIAVIIFSFYSKKMLK